MIRQAFRVLRTLRAVLFVLFASLLAAACGTAPSANGSLGNAISAYEAHAAQVVHIGYQKFGTLSILKARGTLDQALKKLGYRVEWIEFPGGPQLLEAMRAGSIDIGHAGEAPPVFAQAGNVPFVYLGHEPASPKTEAILVPKDSPIHSLKDLRGKRIALNKGSNVHYLLVRALQEAGLKYQDIQPVFLAPADARAAFDRGSVDAWVIWDPYFAVAQADLGARVLVDGTNLVANPEFYLARRDFVQSHPDVIQALISAIQETDTWAAAHRDEVAKLLAPQLGIPESTLEIAAQRRTFGYQPMTPATVQAQQQVADTFYRLGLIPNGIRVQDDVIPLPNGGK
jgi:sulfonate transport system substrate-binding protein